MIQRVVAGVLTWILVKTVIPLLGVAIDYYRLKKKERDET
jgi:TM2 domain-containing membrane protein YozV